MSPTENASTGIIITDTAGKVNTERNAGKSKRDTARPDAGDGVITTGRLKNGISTVDSITEKGGKVNTERKAGKSKRDTAHRLDDVGRVNKTGALEAVPLNGDIITDNIGKVNTERKDAEKVIETSLKGRAGLRTTQACRQRRMPLQVLL